jgi:hypothetical protein
MFFLLKYLFDDPLVAWLGVWAFNFSPVFYFYTTCPMPDNLALCSAICSLAFFFRFLKIGSIKNILFSAFLLSLGVAAKLPYIVFAAAPAYYILQQFYQKKWKINGLELQIILIYLGFMLPTLCWYAWVIPTWNNGVIAGIFDNSYTDYSIWEILKYHATVMFPERLLNWGEIPLLFAGMYYGVKKKVWQTKYFGMIASTGFLVLAYWLYEFNMIGTVHDYYMMPFLPLLFIVVAYGVKCVLAEKRVWKWLIMATVVTFPSFAFNYTKRDWSLKKSYFNLDAFRYKEDLRKAIPEGAKCVIINDPTRYVFSYLIDKHGIVFTDECLPASWINGYVRKYGISYLYSNSRLVDEDPEIVPHLEQLLMERGEIRVFKLRAVD